MFIKKSRVSRLLKNSKNSVLWDKMGDLKKANSLSISLSIKDLFTFFVIWIYLQIAISSNIRIIDLIFIAILTRFQKVCPLAFFRYFMSNSRAHIET